MEYDYSGLINLALVTIIYSSFIGPSLKKLGELRDDIANTNFPVIDNEGEEAKKETNKKIDQNGTLLDKKLTQYEDKYVEIKVFLGFFYGILFSIFAVQIGLMVHNNSYPVNQIVSLSSAAVIIVLLIVTINVYMIAPWRLRSYRWLAAKGIASLYTNFLLKPELVLNGTTSNNVSKHEGVNLTIRQHAKFVGYKYILTIESNDCKRLYYVAAGDVGKHTKLSPLAYADGDVGYEYDIARILLKPGNYSVRLLVLNAPYGGKSKIAETLVNFQVTKTPAEGKSYPAVFETTESHYEFVATSYRKKFRIKKITFEDSFNGDDNIIPLLSTRRVIKLMNSLPRPFTMASMDGMLDRHEFEKRMTRRKVFLARAKRLLRSRKKKLQSYRLK